MLKTTYRAANPAPAESPLPPGWTEHKAPSGHVYYYNAETKQSTYTRPSIPSDEPLRIDYGATEPDHVVRASMQAMEDFHKNTTPQPGHFTGGQSYHEHFRRRGHQGDRPKTKAAIPNCSPWLLVKTKLGRRFVHNTETKESFWKFPQDVMMAVIEMDRLEWEAKEKAKEKTKTTDEAKVGQEADRTSTEDAPKGDPSETRGPRPLPDQQDPDSDSYEEVEVTDNEEEAEDDAGAAKRPRLSRDEQDASPSAPLELGEDDIAYQLAQMGEDYDAYDDDVAGSEGEQEDDNDAGLPLTADDKMALFRSLLDDSGLSPYSTFEKLIEDTYLVEDPRWVALPSTTARKEAFAKWSKDRISQQQALKLSSASDFKTPQDPKIPYLRFLQKHATPKLYWPEFKRRFKREHEMRDLSLQDKEREKLYREYINKVKTGETERRKELVSLLKSVEKGSLSRGLGLDELPQTVLRDVRFYTLAESRRDELVKTFLETL